ncbi:MAG TPA: TRAP transporter large permease [Kofleriaceae bacterium]|nr:TRAP transporter large permease [Kofleriaceae bacterium]
MVTLLIILLVLLFISGAPLFTIMLGATALGTAFSRLGFEIGFDGAINKMFGISGRDEIEVLSTIPLFIFAGYILAESKTADRLVRFANALLGWAPGGLAIVTIGTCAIFTVFTGASGVTIIALGGVLMPGLVRNGYPRKFSMGLIAGTGSVGLLFPPALPLFIYGTVYGLTGLDKENWSTDRFLFAGIVPGMLLIAMLSAVAIFVAVRKKLPTQKFSLPELGKSFLVAIPEMLVPIGVMGLLVTGTFGLPEIAALTVVYVVLLEMLVFRTITFKQLWGVSFEAMAMIGAIFMIIFASTAFTDFLVNAEVPKQLVAWTQENVHSKILFLLAINVILLIVGTVMDIFSAIVVVLPLIAPISRAYGIDPYHLGVIFLLNLEVGYLHPPVGLNLFLTSVRFQRPITEVMWATIPFLVTMIVALGIVTYVPSLTIVPEAKRTAPVSNLVEIAANGVEESQVSAPEITLVDAAGNVIKDHEGKTITRKFVDCRKPAPLKPGEKPISKEEQDREIRNCQELFFEVTKCKPDAKSTDPKQLGCANHAIAEWTVKQLNEDVLHPERAVILMKELALVDDAGKPFEHEVTVVDAQGKPVMDGEDEKKEMKPILGKDGKPLVKTLASCASFKVDSERDNCRALFAAASSCRINFEDPSEECVTEASKDCPTDTPQATETCKKERAAGCLKKSTDECTSKAIADWIDENPSLVNP